jgi:hypothetical protein
MPLSCCSQRTRHASAVRLFLLVFPVELFQLQNRPPSKYLWRPRRLVFYAAPTFLPYASVDSEIHWSSLSLAARGHFPSIPRSSHTLRSFQPPMHLFEFPPSPMLSSRVSVVVLLSAFVRVFRSSLPGLSLYSLSTHTMFHYFTLVWNVPFYGISCSYLLFILSPHLRPFGPVSFPSFASPVRSIAFYVSCFDAPLNLCRLAFETLASR